MVGHNAIIADPLFKDAAQGDFHLGEKSPARGAGAAFEIAPIQDVEGNAWSMDVLSLGALAE